MPALIYLQHADLQTPAERFQPGALTVQGDKILSLGLVNNLPCPAGAQTIDLEGMKVVPGFIDLQINGAFGMDFTTQPETIWHVGEMLTRYGLTSFLPTIVSSPRETIQDAQEILEQGPPAGYRGARVLGLHLEGPYLNPAKKGAHNPAYLRLPDENEYSGWSPTRQVRLVTLAPELDGSLSAIQTLVHNGVVVAAGHSAAGLDQAQAGFEAGIRYATHLFNAMPPLDHRKPGLVAAVLRDARLTSGLIVDGVHLDPTIVDLVWKTLGSRRFNTVSDTMAPLGMPQGEYYLGGRKVIVNADSACLEDGRLAGSLLSLDQALRNLINYTGCDLSEALITVTQVPAQLLRLEKFIGRLTAGTKADFVVLSPDDHVHRVWINGRCVFPAQD